MKKRLAFAGIMASPAPVFKQIAAAAKNKQEPCRVTPHSRIL
jgi:hypothetical protein